jgi:hypothetical protein
MKTFQDRIKKVTTKGWISFGVWCAIYIAFVVWVAWGDWASLGWLVLLPIIADINWEVKALNDKEYLFNNMLKVSVDGAVKPTVALDKRFFNQVGGFQYLPLEVTLEAGKTTEIVIDI